MVVLSVYAMVGVVAFGAYPHLGVAGKFTYWMLFPVHAALLCWLTAVLSFRGRLRDNKPLAYAIGIILCILALLSG